jgi:hypothetical protein
MPEKTLFEGALIFQFCVEPIFHADTCGETGGAEATASERSNSIGGR